MRFALTGVFLLLVHWSLAQVEASDVTGKVFDSSNGSAVIGATVIFHNIKDTTRSKYAITTEEGAFIIEHAERAFYKIYVQSVGYKKYSRLIRLTGEDVNLGAISLKPDSIMLNAIEIEGEVVPVETKGDTTVYNADAFKVNPDASTKDLVTKMPGIVVDGAGVSANGETCRTSVTGWQAVFRTGSAVIIEFHSSRSSGQSRSL